LNLSVVPLIGNYSNMKQTINHNRITTLFGKSGVKTLLLIVQLLLLFLLLEHSTNRGYTLPLYLATFSCLLTAGFVWTYRKELPDEKMAGSLLESIPEGFLELDRQGNILQLNQRACSLLGNIPAAKTGKHVGLLFPEDAYPQFYKAMQLVVSEGNVQELEVYMAILGAWFSVEMSPGARGITVFFRDITDSKKQASLLQLFESVITRSADSILITSAAPTRHPGPEIVYVNDAFTQMTGYQPEDVIGLTPRILQGPGTSRKELDRIQEALLQWKPVEVELLNYKKNKEEFWVSISIVPVSNEQGWFTHWVSIQRDITARKREEELLIGKNQELKDLSNYLQNIRENEREHIAREVHEELGQLTSALKMDIDWLSIRLKGGEEAIRNRLDTATSTLKIMLSYIQKIAARLRPSILDHFGLTVALEAHCRELQHQNGIECIFESQMDEQDLSEQTKTALYRIAQELLTNVLTHSGASWVRVVLSENEQNIELSVTDNGLGFETSEKRDTLGLVGLRERAHSLKGALIIESKPGLGTSVFATIPKKMHL
jgi:PAS domain S-box-containing protein